MMRHRLTGTLALGLLVLLLAALAWRSLEPPPATAQPPLTRLDPAKVRALTLLNGAGTEIRLRRGKPGWEMLTPYPLPADDQRIGQLLALARTPSHARFDEPAERLGEFGLAPPKALVWLDAVEVRFGSPHPLEKLRFVASGGQLHLTEERFFHLLLLPAESWVGPLLLPEAGELTAIRTPTWDLNLEGSAGWRLQPEGDSAGAAARAHKARQWREARAARVERAPAGAISGWVELRLRGQDSPLHLGVLRQGTELLLVREEYGLAYRFPSAALLLPPGVEERDAGITGG
jgi:hypothetical protein